MDYRGGLDANAPGLISNDVSDRGQPRINLPIRSFDSLDHA